MKKVSLKATDLGSLDMALKSSSTSYQKQVDVCYDMGWERILPLEIYYNVKTWKQIVIFFVKRSDIKFQAYK